MQTPKYFSTRKAAFSRYGKDMPGAARSRPQKGPSSGIGNPSRGSSSRFSSGSGSRFGGGRGRSSNRGPHGSKGEKLDFTKFVNKVSVIEEAELFIPEHAFKDFELLDTLKQSIIKKGYEVPTPIQDRAIPHVLKGDDVVGIANTGTGKTATFLIPLINKILKNRKEQVMVIVPTRELAIQIEQELISLVAGMKIFSVCVVGGAPIGKQLSQLKFQYNFIIGTPGRIKDMIERKTIFLKEFNTIVLDEADRMLDMGFVADMRAIMAGMPKDRQTLFFSATLSSDIEKLIGEFLRMPVRISVKTRDTSKNVEQDVIKLAHGADKLQALSDLLKQPEFSKVLVFGRTKHGVERLSRSLVSAGLKAESIHGDKNHGQRQRALKAFKEHQVNILVATDVAARGLDIPDVTHVINYDLPSTYDDYVHRIGRTGRGSKKGKALTFV